MGKKQKTLTATFTIALLIFFAFELDVTVNADLSSMYRSFPIIHINADGTITPQTDLISRNGNLYTLNDDMNGTQISIECSNIVFDGNGHSITIKEGTGMNPAIYISATSTTIQNVQIFTNLYTGILMNNCSSCQIMGVRTSGYVELMDSYYNIISENTGPFFLKSEHNQIFINNITGLDIWAGSNVFYENNILLDNGYTPYADEVNFWDNGSIGNYWSNYAKRYPNASEAWQTGIGNTPYMLDVDNIDHYPVMYPFNTENGAIALPSREPSAQLFASPNSEAGIAIGVSVVFIVAVTGAGLLYRRSQRKKPPLTKQEV
jgi:hypothetical protein